MAEVTARRDQRIERDLDWSLWQWGRLPEVAAEINE